MHSANNFQKFVGAKDALGLFIALLIMLVLNHAGGHIIAPVVAIAGVIGFFGHRLGSINWRSALLLAFGAFFLWILLSSLWSPFEDNREFKNLYRFALGIPLYAFAALWLSDLSENNKRLLRALVIILLPLSALIFMLDIVSAYRITLSVDPEAIPGNIEANIGHGVSAVIIFAVPTLFYLMAGGMINRAIAAILILSLAVISLTFNNTAFTIAFFGTALVLALSYFKPRFCFSAIMAGLAGMVIMSPILGYFASRLTDADKAALPFSWEWRVESWAYVHNNLYDNILFGHGFDSLRAITDTFDARGFEGLATMPMHPHNIGLHIWYELGLVGIILFCAALFFAARKVITSSLSRTQIMALCGVSSVAISFSALSYSPWSDWWLGAIFWAFGMVFCIKPLSQP